MSGWIVRFTDHTSTPHVVPVDDLREHDPENCWCCPTFNEDIMWVHHAMDKREEFEPDYQFGITRQPS
jgi:hypothetical protein